MGALLFPPLNSASRLPFPLTSPHIVTTLCVSYPPPFANSLLPASVFSSAPFFIFSPSPPHPAPLPFFNSLYLTPFLVYLPFFYFIFYFPSSSSSLSFNSVPFPLIRQKTKHKGKIKMLKVPLLLVPHEGKFLRVNFFEYFSHSHLCRK